MTRCSFDVSFISYSSWPYFRFVLNQSRSFGHIPVEGWNASNVRSYTSLANALGSPLPPPPLSAVEPSTVVSAGAAATDGDDDDVVEEEDCPIRFETLSSMPFTPFSMALGLMAASGELATRSMRV